MSESDEPRDETLEGVIETGIDAALRGVRVSLPGKITAYDPTTQLASAQPLVMDAHVDEEQERVAKPLPEVHNAPVKFAGSHARARITWPVFVGDICEISYHSSAISKFVTTGRLMDPGDDRHHDLTDATVWVGLHSAANVPTTAPVNAIVLHVSDGVIIQLGGDDADDPVARKSDLAAIVSAHNSHVHVETGTSTNVPTVAMSTPDCSDVVKSK